MAMTEAEYRAEQEARQQLTDQTLRVTALSVPVPTQEELDLMRHGLMHVDDKANPDVPEMPSTRAQNVLLKRAEPHVDGGPALPQPGAPENKDVPHLQGSGTVGETLTCTKGNWSGMQQDVANYAYQWQADGENVKADTGGDTYIVEAEDVGKSITCIVSATNTLGTTAAPASNAITINPIGARRGRS
jgi:hypothetical protein